MAWDFAREFRAPSTGYAGGFENGSFTLKTHQIFFVHTTPSELKNTTNTGHFGLFLTKPGSGKSHDYRDAIAFEKLRFQNDFLLHENEKPAFSNSSGPKSVFEKLRFRDRAVWTVGLTVEIKLRFQISPAQCGRCLRFENLVFNIQTRGQC